MYSTYTYSDLQRLLIYKNKKFLFALTIGLPEETLQKVKDEIKEILDRLETLSKENVQKN